MTTLFTSRSSFQTWRDSLPEHTTVGFVPTMGALHVGHISLIEKAKVDCDLVIVSIYVNALQFNSEQDYNRYPRTEESDFQQCEVAKVDAVFAPVKSDLFPEDVVELIPPSNNALGYEGADRPGHFAGVATVVDRLFSVVQPTNAYFGLKDYQQVAVINDMASQLHPATNAQDLIASITYCLSQDPAVHVQYVSVVRKGTMEEVQTACENDVILAAVVVDGIRLIDNMSLISA